MLFISPLNKIRVRSSIIRIKYSTDSQAGRPVTCRGWFFLCVGLTIAIFIITCFISGALASDSFVGRLDIATKDICFGSAEMDKTEFITLLHEFLRISGVG